MKLTSSIKQFAFILVATLAISAASSASPTRQPSPHLRGYWQFDESDGLIVSDRTHFANDGMLAGPTLPTRVDGRFLRALDFNQNFVEIPQSPSLEPQTLTVEAWVKADVSPGAFRHMVAKGALQCLASSYALYTASNGGLAFYISDGNSYVVSPVAAPAQIWNGAWHHVAGTYDGTSVRLYIDGAEVGTGTFGTLAINYALGDDRLLIGQYPGQDFCADRHDFVGQVDEPRVWDRALGAPEVAASAAMGQGSADRLQFRNTDDDCVVFTPRFTNGSTVTISTESCSGERFVTDVRLAAVCETGSCPTLGVLTYSNGNRTVSTTVSGGNTRVAELLVTLDDGTQFTTQVRLR